MINEDVIKIKKSIILLATVGIIFILLTGCASSTQMNIRTDNGSVNTSPGISRLQKLGSGLYYDQTTGIVYWWNGSLIIGSNVATTPTPYYSEHGKLYRYDPASNTMGEIK